MSAYSCHFMDASSTTSGAERALSSRSILSRAAASIGNDADVLLKDPWEAIALIGHACMAAVSFRLIGLDESHRIGLLPSLFFFFLLSPFLF